MCYYSINPKKMKKDHIEYKIQKQLAELQAQAEQLKLQLEKHKKEKALAEKKAEKPKKVEQKKVEPKKKEEEEDDDEFTKGFYKLHDMHVSHKKSLEKKPHAKAAYTRAMESVKVKERKYSYVPKAFENGLAAFWVNAKNTPITHDNKTKIVNMFVNAYTIPEKTSRFSTRINCYIVATHEERTNAHGVGFKFDKAGKSYHIPEFHLLGNNFDQFKLFLRNEVQEMIDYIDNQDGGYGQGYLDSFKIINVRLPATTEPVKCDSREHIIVEQGCKLFSGKSTGGNCWFSATEKGLSIVNPSFVQDLKLRVKIRQELNIAKGDGIKYEDHAEAISTYYDCTYLIYDENCKFICSKGNGKHQIPISIKMNHARLILDNHYNKYCTICCRSYHNTHTCYAPQVKEVEHRRNGKDKVSVGYKDKKKPFNLEKMIYFDLETFSNGGYNEIDTSGHNVYACGWHNEDGYEQSYGKNSFDKFFADLMLIWYDEKGNPRNENDIMSRTLCAYNGSGFDFYFLLDQIGKRGGKIKPGSYIESNGKLMSFSFSLQHGDEDKIKYCKVFDLYLFITSSLKDAGNSFKIPDELKKKEFDHMLITNWDDVEKYRKDIEPYLKNDVLGLKAIFETFAKKMFELFNVYITDFMTLSHMAYYLWARDVSTNEDDACYLPYSWEDYLFISRSIYGARCYPMQKKWESKDYKRVVEYIDKLKSQQFTNEQINEKVKNKFYGTVGDHKIKDYIFNADAVSLYPTAMTREYPVGHYYWLTDQEVQNINSDISNMKIGIYEIDYVCNKKIIVPILPKHLNGGIVWDLLDGSGVYNSIDIMNAINNGYQVTIKRGIYWNKSKKIFNDYIQKCFKLKADAEKAGNAVERSIAKLLMNALYGKTLQAPILDEKAVCENMNEMYSFLQFNTMQTYSNFGDKLIVKGLSKEEFRKGKVTKPRHLGSFVLGYSREIMLNVMLKIDPSLSKHFFNYTDTDSLHIHSEYLPLIQHIIGKSLGCMSNDTEEDGIILAEYCLAPKTYMYIYLTKNGELKTKMKCKGIPKQYLSPTLYTDYINNNSDRINEIDMFRLKKIKPDAKHDNFTITNVVMKRSFMKTHYDRMFLADDGKYYPIGFE